MNDNRDCQTFWDETAEEYQNITRISIKDFHYGPLLPGDKKIGALPKNLKGLKCLEIGAGAGQNSIYLASKGAICTVTDVSGKQLRYGEQIAKNLGLDLKFERAGLDDISEEAFGKYDFIHTTWAMPFASDQAAVIRNCAVMLNPGGSLHVTTGHPMFCGEWIELDDYEAGMFVTNYFEPPREVRFTKDEENFIRTQQHPISTYVNWILDSGLKLEKMLELQPVELELLTEKELEEATPYDSEVWREMYEQIKKIPFVVTYIAHKEA